MSDDIVDYDMMEAALAEAHKCIPVPTAFCVGCVIVARMNNSPIIIARGYSRELPGNTHAEANALAKARGLTQDQLCGLGLHADDHGASSVDEILRHCHVYSTMEPCSIRTSGLAPCADVLVAAGISRCIIGVGEPDDFVQCEGARKLRVAGIRVDWFKGLEDECLKVARTGHA